MDHSTISIIANSFTERRCLVTPIRVTGSLPTPKHGRMLCGPNGRICGTIGGGALEGFMVARSQEMIRKGITTPIIQTFILQSNNATSLGMVCGGSATVLIEHIVPEQQIEALLPENQREPFKRNQNVLKDGYSLFNSFLHSKIPNYNSELTYSCFESLSVRHIDTTIDITGVPEGSLDCDGGYSSNPVPVTVQRMTFILSCNPLKSTISERYIMVNKIGGFLTPSGDIDAIEGEMINFAQEHYTDDLFGQISLGGRTKSNSDFESLSSIQPATQLLIFGGGHCGKALFDVAQIAGFACCIYDDRDEFVSEERFPNAIERRTINFEQDLESIQVNSGSYIVAMTRGHSFDFDVVRSVLPRHPAFIGMIGSKAKCGRVRKQLEDAGFSHSQIGSIFAPIGMDTGGSAPGEIAVSVMAQILMHKYKKGNDWGKRCDERKHIIGESAQNLRNHPFSLSYVAPVQAEAIPLVLGGGDVCISSETGSGKTGAFALPLIQIVYEEKNEQTSTGVTGTVGENIAVGFDDHSCEPEISISEAGLVIQSTGPQWSGGRGNVGVRHGSFYFEATVLTEGIPRIGWSTITATLNLGTDKMGIGFGGTGKFAFAKQFENYGEAYGKGDVIGCFLQTSTDGENSEGLVWFSKNGKEFGKISLSSFFKDQLMYPTFCVKGCSLRFNFGSSEPFQHPPPSNFLSIPGTDCENSSLGVKYSPRAAPAQSDGPGAPLIFILEPSRELAEQTQKCILQLSSFLPAPGMNVVLLIGGDDMQQTHKQLASNPDIVISTTGRAMELIRTHKMTLAQVRGFVIDEADRLLDDNKDETAFDLWKMSGSELPKDKRMQTILVSATLHTPGMKKAMERITHFPTWVDMKGDKAVPETVHHTVIRIDPTKPWTQPAGNPVGTDGIYEIERNTTRPFMLSQEIKLRKAWACKDVLDRVNPEQAIIFCRTKQDCDNLETFFQQFNRKGALESLYSCVVLHGDRSPDERKRNFRTFQNGDVKYLICTDVAARGLDIQSLPCCINYTLPDTEENYIHRTGRVGRADRWGLAVSLVATEKEKVWYHTCPSRGKKCRNVRLTDEGGCTIWYDEPALFKLVEARLGNVTVPTLDEHLSGSVQVKYGLERAAEGSGRSHSDNIKESVEDLKRLEKEAQMSFLQFTSQFGSQRQG
ncbi:putative ATP-dependent RNA helicase Ddx1 [Blattamonas nauphoetae]|uniref:ATP-dependent RNA helicase Ddx1 n=1 Tax=Blattamonas nauphoetae TaxID=2049346 RepID=A0ABQ9WTH5_9EUKA|nr:putative ATP-dependent RNA helicase Ddx1 [Blattamonas nauphoetae]